MTLAVAMIRPWGETERCGIAARARRKAARRFTSCTRSQASSVMLATKAFAPIPALLKRMSRAPKLSIARSMMANGASGVARSAARLVISAFPKPRSAPGRSTASTRAPSAAKSSALARPMPDAAPVTIAARP
jgi:hypothetical protein